MITDSYKPEAALVNTFVRAALTDTPTLGDLAPVNVTSGAASSGYFSSEFFSPTYFDVVGIPAISELGPVLATLAPVNVTLGSIRSGHFSSEFFSSTYFDTEG